VAWSGDDGAPAAGGRRVRLRYSSIIPTYDRWTAADYSTASMLAIFYIQNLSRLQQYDPWTESPFRLVGMPVRAVIDIVAGDRYIRWRAERGKRPVTFSSSEPKHPRLHSRFSEKYHSPHVPLVLGSVAKLWYWKVVTSFRRNPAFHGRILRRYPDGREIRKLSCLNG
jgi:hypothetical protein